MTGMTVRDGQLLLKGQPVQTVSLAEVMRRFLTFLAQFNKPILVGHNIQGYDMLVLYANLLRVDMVDELQEMISGCLDTLMLARETIPEHTLPSHSYGQESLVKDLLGEEYESHNALADARSLRDLYMAHMRLSARELREHTLKFDNYNCWESLERMMHLKIISHAIRVRLAHHSIGLRQLKLAFERDPRNGIGNLFREPWGIKQAPKITKTKRIIESVNDYLSEYRNDPE